MTSTVAELFSRIAPHYDRLNHLLSLSRDKKWRRKMIDAITPRLSLRVVDLCAGTLDSTVAMRPCRSAVGAPRVASPSVPRSGAAAPSVSHASRGPRQESSAGGSARPKASR